PGPAFRPVRVKHTELDHRPPALCELRYVSVLRDRVEPTAQKMADVVVRLRPEREDRLPKPRPRFSGTCHDKLHLARAGQGQIRKFATVWRDNAISKSRRKVRQPAITKTGDRWGCKLCDPITMSGQETRHRRPAANNGGSNLRFDIKADVTKPGQHFRAGAGNRRDVIEPVDQTQQASAVVLKQHVDAGI